MDKCENFKDEFGDGFCHEDYPPRSCRCDGDRTACERGNSRIVINPEADETEENGRVGGKQTLTDALREIFAEGGESQFRNDSHAEKENSVKKIRQEVLEKAIHMVCGDREDDYGDPEDSFTVIAGFWEVYIKAKCAPKGTEITILPEDVAALMALFKIARIASGRFKMDSWVDCAGYCANGAELQGRDK